MCIPSIVHVCNHRLTLNAGPAGTTSKAASADEQHQSRQPYAQPLEGTWRRALRSGGRMTPLLAYMSPHALHRVRGPCGPLRIMGVSWALAPQLTHLHAHMVRLAHLLLYNPKQNPNSGACMGRFAAPGCALGRGCG